MGNSLGFNSIYSIAIRTKKKNKNIYKMFTLKNTK